MIAGPNGSGKTTLTNHLRSIGFDLAEYINADDIALGLKGSLEEASREAQRLADAARASCLDRGVSFSFETVMSHPSKVELLKTAKARGYYLMLFFVGVEDPRINVERVAMRVAQGGHPVPVDRIISRYGRTMALLPEALLVCDRTILFDNSHREVGGGSDLRVLCEVEHGADDLEVLKFIHPREAGSLSRTYMPWWASDALQAAERRLARGSKTNRR